MTSVVNLGPTSHLSLRDLHALIASTSRQPGESITYITRDPDLSSPRWAGQPIPDHPGDHHRPWRIHVELLRVLGYEMLTPHVIPESEFVEIRARKQDPGASGPVTLPPEDIEGRYGSESDYRLFDRLEEPEVLDDYMYAASRLALESGETLLSLGTNDGRELMIFGDTEGVHVVGIDQSATAIERAKQQMPSATFHVGDISNFEDLVVGPVDVVVCLNVLQCRTLDRDAVLASINRHTHEGSRILISVPNCHRTTHDIQRRPRNRRDRRHDRSLVFKDARHYARHLYRSGRRRIEIFGTYDILILATPEPRT